MINRQNWMDTRAWLATLDRSPKTIQKYRIYLRHLIEWADETPLPNARLMDPAFPTYLITSRNDGKQIPLSYTTIYKTLSTTRMFFTYARHTWTRYNKISDSWVELLYPSRLSKPQPQIDDHKYYNLDELHAIASVSTETLHEARAQAAACLLYLSGMRADTLSSLPLQCVDLPNMRIFQVPSMGPRTKNNKAAITYLLNIPELLEIVRAWDDRLRRQSYAPNALWLAPLNHDGMVIHESTHAIQERSVVIRDDIALICKKAGIEYLSPHKFRHGHIVYARSHARNMEDVKAISQNVMHANSIITDQIYSGLTSNQVRNIITSLGNSPLQKVEEENANLNKKITELITLLQR
jgi:site-specific recombinase XerD